MDLTEFHALVSTALKRGTALDSAIPTQVKLAVQWLERNYTMKYMEKFRTLSIVADDRTIQMPENKIIKAAKFIRTVGADGQYQYLNKIEPEDMTGLRSASTVPASNDVVPRAYFIVGNSTLVLDSVPDVAMSGEAILYEYTDWPTALSSQPALLQFAADVVLAQTLWYIAVFILKDSRMAAEYKTLRDEGVNTLTRADDETKYGGESMSMSFAPAGV